MPSPLRLLPFALALATLQSGHAAPDRDRETVGPKPNGHTVTPVNQTLTPFGRQIPLAGLRPQVLALSPDSKRLLVSGKTSELLVLDPADGTVLQRVPFPSESRNEPAPAQASGNILEPDRKGIVSYTGLAYSPDGKSVVLSNVNGSLKVFSVQPDGSLAPSHSIPLPKAGAPRRKEEIPAGLAFHSNGSRLLVCANLGNRLLEIDPQTGKVLRTFEVGVAPLDVVVTGQKAYVSNWGGRRPAPGDLTGPAGRGTEVRVDPVRHIASEGSLSIIDLRESAPQPPKEIAVGLHPSALAVSPNGRHVVCANSASDTLTVLDTRTDSVAETIWTRINPGDLFGASPNALAFAPNGKTLYAANGTQNAVAVLQFEPAERESRLTGLIPVGWFPGALLLDSKRQQLAVANLKGLPTEPKPSPQKTMGFNSHQHHGSVSLLPVPSREKLAELSATVSLNLRGDAIAQSRLPARNGVPARPVPERIGEPSVFKHVVYIIKENRTYDQVFGDDPRGNGAPELCVFGKSITPNLHKLASDFVLLDNTYCSGLLSADGHQWSTTAFATAVMEKSFAGFPRSYPDGMGDDEKDALIYAPTGFLWDNALKHQKSLRNFGEFAIPRVRWKDPARKGSPDYVACFKTWKGESDEVVFGCEASVPSLAPFTPSKTVGWNMAVPDQFRADFFIRDLKQAEQSGDWPNLLFICLPQDHTSGTKPRLRPHRGGHLQKPVLEGNPHPRHRGRSAERLGPCQRVPHHGLLHQPLHQTRRRHLHPVQHHQPDPHDRAGAGAAPHEPVRRLRHPHVRLFHRRTGFLTLHRAPQPRPTRPAQPAHPGPFRPGLQKAQPALGQDQLRAGRPRPGRPPQQDPLAVHDRRLAPVPGMGHPRRTRRGRRAPRTPLLLELAFQTLLTAQASHPIPAPLQDPPAAPPRIPEVSKTVACRGALPRSPAGPPPQATAGHCPQPSPRTTGGPLRAEAGGA